MEIAGFTPAEWDAARSWPEYLEAVCDKRDIWAAHWKRASIEPGATRRLTSLPAPRRVLVLTEDWCGDAARSVPVLARAFEAAAGQVEHRYLDTDSHPETLGRFLTHGGRAIPMAIVQDEVGRRLGVWGPRPASLQAFVRARREEMGPPTPDTMAEWYAPILGWYGKDRGRALVDEILMVLERGGPPR